MHYAFQGSADKPKPYRAVAACSRKWALYPLQAGVPAFILKSENSVARPNVSEFCDESRWSGTNSLCRSTRLYTRTSSSATGYDRTAADSNHPSQLPRIKIQALQGLQLQRHRRLVAARRPSARQKRSALSMGLRFCPPSGEKVTAGNIAARDSPRRGTSLNQMNTQSARATTVTEISSIAAIDRRRWRSSIQGWTQQTGNPCYARS